MECAIESIKQYVRAANYLPAALNQDQSKPHVLDNDTLGQSLNCIALKMLIIGYFSNNAKNGAMKTRK
ncbi:TPA: hypothetical protein ACP9DH_003307 [Legionella anisa]